MATTTNPDLSRARAILRVATDEGTLSVDHMIALGLPPYAASVRTALHMAGIDAATARLAASLEGWTDSPLSD